MKERRSIKRKGYTRGARYVANVAAGEVHDMTRVCASCRIGKIARRRDANTLEELRLALGAGLKPHKDCFGVEDNG